MNKRGWMAWLLICSMLLPGTLAEAGSVKKPKLSKTKLVLKVGAGKKLSIKNRRRFRIKKVTFSSSKSRVAKVSKKGKVKALRKGKTTITCKVVLKNKKKYRLKCKVTVKASKERTDKRVASKTSIPEKPPMPKETAKPTGTGNPQETIVPSQTGESKETLAPSETIQPRDTADPSGTRTPQNTAMPSGSKVPVTEKPVPTTPGTEPVAESRFTLPPAATFTPSIPLFHRIGNCSKLTIAKNAGLAFFLGAIVAFPSEVLSSLERLRAFFMLI